LIKVYPNSSVSVCSSYKLPCTAQLMNSDNAQNQERNYLVAHLLTPQETPERNINSSVTSKNSALILQQAQNDADRIVGLAKEEAERICTNAQNQAKEVIQAERQKGYKEGFEAASAEAERILAKRLEQIEALSQTVAQERENLKDDCWENVKLLALQAAKKIVGELLPVEDVYMAVFKKAAVHIPKTEKIKIVLSGREFELAAKNVEKIRNIFDGSPNVELIREPQTQEDKVLIITSDREVDASLHNQFCKISAVFDQL